MGNERKMEGITLDDGGADAGAESCAFLYRTHALATNVAAERSGDPFDHCDLRIYFAVLDTDDTIFAEISF